MAEGCKPFQKTQPKRRDPQEHSYSWLRAEGEDLVGPIGRTLAEIGALRAASSSTLGMRWNSKLRSWQEPWEPSRTRRRKWRRRRWRSGRCWTRWSRPSCTGEGDLGKDNIDCKPARRLIQQPISPHGDESIAEGISNCKIAGSGRFGQYPSGGLASWSAGLACVLAFGLRVAEERICCAESTMVGPTRFNWDGWSDWLSFWARVGFGHK